MNSAIVDSSFDVAYWFIDKALDDGEYLQPQKLHRLMFLAQAYFAAMRSGRMLMPAVFIASDFGPIEPSVFRACEVQRPEIEPREFPETAKKFLDVIWRKFGALPAESLNRLVNGHPPYATAYASGVRSVISLESMVAFYGNDEARIQTLENSDNAEKQLMRSQDGRPVSVKKWMPKSV